MKAQKCFPSSYSFFFFFQLCQEACGILAPPQGVEPVPPAVEVWSLNHWTAREFPHVHTLTSHEKVLFTCEFQCTSPYLPQIFS